ncbi:MAG: hydroxymethylglutaryl-CoA synthase [Myxococcota bacterium]|nr:hydroxymethylglutaryl-CoA synthase [Myxococcota bacterium]
MSDSHSSLPSVGISGFTTYFPQQRIDLKDWSDWSGAHWDKIQAVVGSSFRVADPLEDVYSMSAEAVFRLLKQLDISPSAVGMVILATESSLDNAVGASTLKGLVDRKLKQEGLPPLDNNCETYELKQACLAGVYGLKQALRWAMLAPADRVAIVVSADIAEYELGSSGEPTQGAGAVAMLVGQQPTLLEIDPRFSGSASVDRETDFRKPLSHQSEGRKHGTRRSDFPVFDGPYSTKCYLETVCNAFAHLVASTPPDGVGLDSPLDCERLFFHRPYRQLPERAASTLVAQALEGSMGEHERGRWLDTLDHPTPVQPKDRYELGKKIHKSKLYQDHLAPRLELGKELTSHFGNLYTASLPAWIAAAFAEAETKGGSLAGERWLLIGYGSGDAAEALVATVVPGWEKAAAAININAAMADSVALSHDDYIAIHRDGESNTSSKLSIKRTERRDSEGKLSTIPAYDIR